MAVEQDASISLAIQQLDSIFAPVAGPSVPTSLAIKKKRAAKREALAVSTPALMSLLPAAKKRKLQLAESRAATPGPSGSNGADNPSGPPSPRKLYRPNSLEDLLERLSSYSMALWNDGKPLQCSAVAFARHGWKATAKKREQVICEMCEQVWEARNSNDWRSEDGKLLQAEMVEHLSSKHAKSCPWRSRPCPPNLYQLPLSRPASQLIRDLVERAASHPREFALSISHPLSETELSQLRALLQSSPAKRITLDFTPSEQSILCSLFGWQAVQSSNTSSAAILQCKYCTRRLLAKSQASDQADQPALPDKLATTNLRTSHRRFCAYITPVSDQDQREGWQAMLEALFIGYRPDSDRQMNGTASSTDASRSNLHTKETLNMVRELLRGGRTVKRQAA